MKNNAKKKIRNWYILYLDIATETNKIIDLPIDILIIAKLRFIILNVCSTGFSFHCTIISKRVIEISISNVNKSLQAKISSSKKKPKFKISNCLYLLRLRKIHSYINFRGVRRTRWSSRVENTLGRVGSGSQAFWSSQKHRVSQKSFGFLNNFGLFENMKFFFKVSEFFRIHEDFFSGNF